MKEILMAEGTTGQGPEGATPTKAAQPQRGWYITEEFDQNRKDYRVRDEGEYQVTYDPDTGRAVKRVLKKILENAALTEEKRKQKAAEEIGKEQLTEEQEKALIRMHEEGLGEQGKDRINPASVGNYTPEQLERKLNAGGEAFTLEEKNKLIRSGLAGAVPTGVFTNFDKTSWVGTPLENVVDDMINIGAAGGADEVYLKGRDDEIRALIKDGQITRNQAKEPLRIVNALRIAATERGISPELGRQPSTFEQTLFNIAALQNLPDSPGKTDSLQKEIAKLNEGLEKANEAGLFQSEKPGLFDLLRMGRIDVSIRDKREGTKFRHISDVKTRSEQTTVESEAFWNDPRYPQRRQLRALFGGSVDYFMRGSTALIESVIKNPRIKDSSGNLIDILADRDYSGLRQDYAGVDGIIEAWAYRWVNGRGVSESANNFEEMRKKVEQERQERPRFMKHPWYRSVEFFADDMSELGLATRDFVRYAIDNLQRGESDAMYQNLKEEQTAGQSAFKDAILYFERAAKDPMVRWISSEMNSVFNMAAIGFFQRLGGKGVEKGAFKYFTDAWSEGLRVTDTSVNYEDALTLDEDGMFLYIAEKLCEKDGEFYRFGSNSSEVPTMNELYTYLRQKRAEIIEDAAKHRLRPIGDSISPNYLFKTYNAGDPNNPITLSDPKNLLYKHFIKLKEKYNEIDAKDRANGIILTESRWGRYVERNKGGIPSHRAFAQVKAKCDLKDAGDILAGITITESRWDIYRRGAKAWEDFARYRKDDLRDPTAKVKFTHPLARAWNNDQEFLDMYEEVTATTARKERSAYLITRVEDYLRFNMIDARSGSARIKIRAKGPDGRTIRNGKVERVEAYTNVLRDELKRTMALDETRPHLDKRFKVTYILKQMGYRPEMPAYGLFSLGADDTIRNEAIVAHFYEEAEFADLFREIELDATESQARIDNYKSDLKKTGLSNDQIAADSGLKAMLKLQKYVDDRIFRGSNPKAIIVKFTEDERLAVQAVQRAIRDPDNKKYGNSGGDYDNFPGEDNPYEEGGTKWWKNILYLDFGTSRGTVRVNGMIPYMNSGVLDRISELGGWSPKYITGLRHRGDEIELADEGTLLIDPKDTQGYLTRLESLIKKKDLWTSAGDAEKKPGAMIGGFFSGMYLLRELGTHTEFFGSEFTRERGEGLPKTIESPVDALDPRYLTETGKKAFLDTTAAVVKPLEAIMRANRGLETAYGYAQGTAKNMNTILMQDIGHWMDNYWYEYMGDFGYAVDGMLHMARSYMYVYLKEEGLIWPEKKTKAIEGWDDISKRLVKDLPEDLRIGVPLGSFMYPAAGSIKMLEGSVYLKAPTIDKKKEREDILKSL